MAGDRKTTTGSYRTRQAIIDLLKEEGPMDAGALAVRLDVSDMAVRQHLYDLSDEDIVTFRDAKQKIGRPLRIWELTAEANRFFPDGHALLTTELLASMSEALGEKDFQKLLDVRSRRLTAAYEARMSQKSLRGRLGALARIRTGEGYMAHVAREPDGAWLLAENHCPICEAASACSGLCASELAVFRAVLGKDVEIERIDHILAGARRCAYRIRPATDT